MEVRPQSSLRLVSPVPVREDPSATALLESGPVAASSPTSSRPPKSPGLHRSTSTPASSAWKSARLQAAPRLAGASPTAMEKASRCAAICNLDIGPSDSRAPCPDSDDICVNSFSALVGVPLGRLGKVAADSAIVFRGEKGPVLEQLASLQAKEILEGHLAATQAREAATAAELPPLRPAGPGVGGSGSPCGRPDEIRGRTRSRTAQLRRALSATTTTVGSREEPLGE
nr:nascent polypeptide-associated complex subunit alpha, muscle-specific form-like [Triticum aestivum]